MLTSVLLLLALAPLVADTTDDDRRRLGDAVRAYVQPFDGTWSMASARVAWIDLNGDGLDDAIVYVEDPDWCGSGGCTVLVFERMNSADAVEMGTFRPAAEVALVQTPIYVSQRRTNQWRDLIVRDERGDVRAIRFTGETYPHSPAEGERLRRRTSGATALFATPR